MKSTEVNLLWHRGEGRGQIWEDKGMLLLLSSNQIYKVQYTFTQWNVAQQENE